MDGENGVNRSLLRTSEERRTVDSSARPKSRGIGEAFDALAILSGPRQRRRASPEWFWARVDKNGPEVRAGLGSCWRWTGRAYREGYGQVTWCGRDVATHRLAYSLAHGRIEAGQVVRHRCDNPICCNPDHLVIGTIADNNRDMAERGRGRTEHLVRPGAANCNAKLTDALVRELRAAWKAGESQKSIVARTGLSVGTIHPMLHGHTWRHVTDEPPESGPILAARALAGKAAAS